MPAILPIYSLTKKLDKWKIIFIIHLVYKSLIVQYSLLIATMKNIIKNTSIAGAVFAFAMTIAPVAAFAQLDGNIGYTDYSSGTSAGYTDYSTPSAGYTDYTSPSAGYTNYSSPSAGYTNYTSPSAGYTDYTNLSPGYTNYTSPSAGYTDYTNSTYSQSTPYYSSPCGCYSSSPVYSMGSAPLSYGYTPSYGVQYTPTYSVGGGYSTSRQSGAMYGVASSPATPSYTSNTNVNAPSFTVTNKPTNTNTATATVAPITNTNTASTGAITNTFAPVINVGAPQQLVQATLPTPSCSIYASGGYATGYGTQSVTLNWNSQNVTSAYISPNVGTVSPQGTQLVYPQGYTTYTMTVYGPGGSATCQATTNYGGGYIAPVRTPIYTATPIQVAPVITPSVTLTQIPYTGFDFGPVGNAMYWTALFALAAAAAYILVYFVPGLTFAFAGSKSKNALDTAEVREVFKSQISVLRTPSVLNDEELAEVAAFSSEKYRPTTDSMSHDTTNGAPRIVIARE